MSMLPKFNNLLLLTTALTHRSALNEKLSAAEENNERLEFLGDAVLELAASHFLYQKYPQNPEGELTAYRSALVRTETLAKIAAKLELGNELYMSKGEEAGGGRQNVSLLANTFEAVLGALYLDQGYQAVAEFLQTHLFPEIDEIVSKKLFKDPKSQLQELVQAQNMSAPEYKVTSSSGPDHNKVFTVAVWIGGKEVASGTGKSKQTAQQAAAQKAIPVFSNNPPNNEVE